MRSLRYFFLFLIFILLVGSVTPVYAQNYRFQVSDLAAIVTINIDGSIAIDYTLKFVNDPGAHAIDIVDIGLPNYDYGLESISGEINGLPINKITNSDVVSPGISLYLQSNEIPAGGSGTVHIFIAAVKNVIFPATQTESEEYASLVFSPHYYYSTNCYGNTNYQATLLLPPGVLDGEARYYIPENWPGGNDPESKIMSDGRIFYTWVSDQANTYSEYQFGASFPSRYLNSGAMVLTPYVQPSSSGSNSQNMNLDSLCPFIFCAGMIGFWGLIIYSATIGAKKRKMQYLPPKIAMEGHGIKRGLTSVEAAVLMEQPMDKIFTMILFGLLKKNAVQVLTKEPLELTAANPLPPDLYGYETDFLAAFIEKQTALRRKLLQTLMINLIKSVGEKLKGFSRKETLVFYEDIMKKAWLQVEQANTPDIKAQVYEEVMDWTMLDKKYDDRTRDVFSGPMVVPAPLWWWRYDPTFARPVPLNSLSGGITPPPISTSGRTISMPTLPGSAFAASVVNSASSFSSKVLGGLPGFTSGVTNVTNPPPSTYRSSGGGSGGGHSCACACACAGCACACAGGGR